MTGAPPQRVLITTDAVGGVWTFATALARGLSAQGIETVLVTLGPAPDDAQRKVAEGIRHLTLVVTDLALEWMDREGRDRMRAERVLRALERQYRPDLVHVNGYRDAACGWVAPVLATAHSCVGTWWWACRKARPPREWDGYMAAVKDGLAAVHVLTAPTRSMLDGFTDFYGYAGPGLVIRNGIALPVNGNNALPVNPVNNAPFALRSRDSGVSKCGKPIILTAGRLWDEAKNVAALNDIAHLLPWPVQAIGPDLAPQAGEAMALSRLTMLGRLCHQDVLSVMAGAEIFAAPARYEPFGLSILEAAASGCALVLGNIPTLRELWQGAALFVPPQDRAALATALLHLIGNSKLRQELQQRAQMRAQRYSLQRMVERYSAVYARLAVPQNLSAAIAAETAYQGARP